MSDRYHKAAKDGLIQVLREATKKEINTKDNDGMTPVLWAAFEGKLDALRLLVGRGGDPDKSDQFGNTALHLASAKGHFPCVDFLVKFGCNIFALDIDNHTPQNLAAINNRDEILRYLDMAAGNLEGSDKKKAKLFKEQAKKHSEKRIKQFTKRQQKQEQLQMQQQNDNEKSNMLKAMKQRLWSGSHGNLSKSKDSSFLQPQENTKFSALVGGGTLVASRGAAQRKIQAIKAKQQQANSVSSSDFKIGEVESNGQRSIRSIEGVKRDSEILYVGTYEAGNNNIGKRGKISDVFEYETISNDGTDNERKSRLSNLSRCVSQPDFLAAGAMDRNDDLAEDVRMQRPAGLFDRPMMGSLAFPRSVSAVLSQMNNDQSSNSSASSTIKKQGNKKSIRPRSQLVISDSDSENNTSDDNENDDEAVSNPLERFLRAWNLDDHLTLLQKHEIDLDTLMLLTEEDLKSIGLPLGPYRKLCVAIGERKAALTTPGAIIDSRL